MNLTCFLSAVGERARLARAAPGEEIGFRVVPAASLPLQEIFEPDWAALLDVAFLVTVIKLPARAKATVECLRSSAPKGGSEAGISGHGSL